MENSLFMNDVFMVSPVAKRAYLEAGESYPAAIKITNPIDAEGTLHYEISVLPYSVIDEDYTADFSTEAPYTDITKWITIEEPTGYVEPNDTALVNYTINVPENTPGGGYYCALAVRSLANEDNGETNGGVAVNDILEIASVIYAQVSGEIIREGEVIENEIPALVFKNPVTTSATLKNTGNIHQDAKISLKASSAITGKTYYINGTSEEEDDTGEIYFTEIIMPGTTRYTTKTIEGLPSLGVFRITQEVSFDGSIDTHEQITILCPIWFLAAILGVFTLTIIAIIFTRKRK